MSAAIRAALTLAVGNVTSPCGKPTAIVSPSSGASIRVVANLTTPGVDVSIVTARPVSPKAPVYPAASRSPESTAAGNVNVVLACSMGAFHSFPVAFQ